MAQSTMKRQATKKRSSMFGEMFTTQSNVAKDHDPIVGHIMQHTSPVASPVSSRRGSAEVSVPIPEPVAAAPSVEEKDGALWLDTARNGIGWGETVVLSYVLLGIVGAFIFWWQNNYEDSLVDCIFMTVSAITGSSLSSVLLQKSSFGSLLTINILAFISSPTWSDLLFIIIWYRKVSRLIIQTSGSSSGNAALDMSMAKALVALESEKGATVFAGIFLLCYTFGVVLLCTIVGGLYMTYALPESFPEKCFGFSCFWVSWFDSAGNFANSGFTLNPPGYIVYADHPFLPLLTCFCMSCGIMYRTTYMSVLLSLIHRVSPSHDLRMHCDHFFKHSVILRTLFDLNVPQLASFMYNMIVTVGCALYFFFAEWDQRSAVTGTDVLFNQLVMFLFLSTSVRWAGTTVMDLSKVSPGSQLVMFCALGLPEVPFNKCDDGSNSWVSYIRRFTLGVGSLHLCVPLGWVVLCQIGSHYSFNTFNCMFEVMSAFFNSGVTISNQDNADLASLSYIGSLPSASKIILLFVMLGGRFRKVTALPQACKEAIASWKASPDSVLDMRTLGSGQISLARMEGQLDPAVQELVELLETVPAIKSLTRKQMLALCQIVSSVTYSHGDTIIRQGDVGENAFIIASGSANVRKSMKPGDPEISLVILQKGSFFGELALINDAPRGASVYSEGGTKCIVLSKSTFETIKDTVAAQVAQQEVAYARSEVHALEVKVDGLEKEITNLRRRRSLNGSSVFPLQLLPDSSPGATGGCFGLSASPVATSVTAIFEAPPLPGSATVDAPSPPVAPLTSSTASRPVAKSRRKLVPLPAPAPGT